MAVWQLGLPTLQTDRVLLREPVLIDAPAIFRELCVPDVCQYVPPPPPAVEGIERMITTGAERRRAGKAFSFGIQPAGSHELAGILQFVSTRDHANRASIPSVWEFGFALSARYWGIGLMSEAAVLAVEFAFGEVGLEGLEAWVIAENYRANRVLEKLGGVATTRPNTRSPDGRTADFVLWTLTNRPEGSSTG